MWIYDRLRHIINFSFHQFGLFGTRWWHGLGTFMLVVGCFATTVYLVGTYIMESEIEAQIGIGSMEGDPAIFNCGATEYCRFTRLSDDGQLHLNAGQNLSITANDTIWLVELLTLSEFRVRRQAFSLSTALGDGEFDVQSFPPVEQQIRMKFTLSLTRDFRSQPTVLTWTIVNWEEYDEYAECENAALGFDDDVSYTCGAFELHFSTETYNKRFRMDQEFVKTAFLIAGSWMVNSAWMWTLVHGLDLVLRMARDLEKQDKRH